MKNMQTHVKECGRTGDARKKKRVYAHVPPGKKGKQNYAHVNKCAEHLRAHRAQKK